MCSAIQNQDYTIVQDYITGLKALLYMKNQNNSVLQKHRPTNALVKDTIDLSDDYDLVSSPVLKNNSDVGGGGPKFGPYLRDQRYTQAVGAAAEMLELIEGTNKATTMDTPTAEMVSTPVRDDDDEGTVKKTTTTTSPVERIIGCGLKTIGTYKSLDQRAQVVALVNEVGW